MTIKLTKTQARTLEILKHVGHGNKPNMITTQTIEGHCALYWTSRNDDSDSYTQGIGITYSYSSPQPRTLQILLEAGLVRVESKSDHWHKWFAL